MVLGALDSSMLFFLPFGIDAVVIYLAARDETWWWTYPILATAGSLTGAAATFWIGKKIGQRVYTHEYRWINREALQKTHNFFEKHGGKTIILARFVPVVRTFAPFVAGVSDMTFTRFQFYNVVGAASWVISLVTAGYLFGDIPIIRENLTAIVLMGVAAATVPIAVGGLYKVGRRVFNR